MPKQTMPVFYINKTEFKPQATVQKSEIKIFNLVTLSTILSDSNIWATYNLLHLAYLVYIKWCTFAHIKINET